MKKVQFIILSSLLIIIIGLAIYYLHYQKVKDDKAEEERIVLLEEKIQPIREKILTDLIWEMTFTRFFFQKHNTYEGYKLQEKDYSPILKDGSIMRADKDSIVISVMPTTINPRNKRFIEYIGKAGNGNYPGVNDVKRVN